MIEWVEAQRWEAEWWGDCLNTLSEERKQIVYARKMGLELYHDGKSPYNIRMNGKSVLDVGGGPVSLLLKCTGLGKAKVIDPLKFPAWVMARYELAGIEYDTLTGEEMGESGWDECWMYNVLPHVADPERLVANVRRSASIVRVFDWIETGKGAGHPQSVSAKQLDRWLGGEGRVEPINQGECRGLAYYGVFAW